MQALSAAAGWAVTTVAQVSTVAVVLVLHRVRLRQHAARVTAVTVQPTLTGISEAAVPHTLPIAVREALHRHTLAVRRQAAAVVASAVAAVSAAVARVAEAVAVVLVAVVSAEDADCGLRPN